MKEIYSKSSMTLNEGQRKKQWEENQKHSSSMPEHVQNFTHKRKFKNTWKNAILMTVTVYMAAVFLISFCLLDSVSSLPLHCFIISGGWLAMIAWANGVFDSKDKEWGN